MARGNQFGRDTSQQLVVRKAMTLNGNKYKGGDAFDWRRAAIAERKVQQLINAGIVAYAGDRKRDPNVRAGKTKANPRITSNRVVARLRAQANAAVRMVARTGGWYDIMRGRTKLNTKGLRKEEAEQLINAGK